MTMSTTRSSEKIQLNMNNALKKDKTRCHVVLMCGLPGAGKSLLASCLETHFETGVVRIEYDALVTERLRAYQDSNELEAWRWARGEALRRLRSILMMTTTELPALILLDDNFHLRSMRRNVYHECQRVLAEKEMRVDMTCLWMDTPLQTCLLHNETRDESRRVPPHVITKMSHTLEPPSIGISMRKDNSSSETTGAIAWDASAMRIEWGLWKENESHQKELMEMIRECIEQAPAIIPPVDLQALERATQKDREETLANALHRYDRLLRCLVGATSRSFRQLGKLPNEVRKTILSNLRQTNKDNDDPDKVDQDILSSYIDGILQQSGGTNNENDLRSNLHLIVEEAYEQFCNS
jgi:predicted kinase